MIEASSSSDESLPKTPEDNKRARNLRRRALSRARSFVAAAIGSEGSLSALELAAVSKKVNVDYVKLLENFLCWADGSDLPLDEDADVDSALVQWFNHLYFRGHLPHVGEKTLAALMHRVCRHIPCAACWGQS